jgi:hypothetical protein
MHSPIGARRVKTDLLTSEKNFLHTSPTRPCSSCSQKVQTNKSPSSIRLETVHILTLSFGKWMKHKILVYKHSKNSKTTDKFRQNASLSIKCDTNR